MKHHEFYESKESLEETNLTRKLSGFSPLTYNRRCIHCGTWQEKFSQDYTLPCIPFPLGTLVNLVEGPQVASGYPTEKESQVLHKINDMFSPEAVDRALAQLYKKPLIIPASIIPNYQCYKEYTHRERERKNTPWKRDYLNGHTSDGYALSRALGFPIPASERREDYLSPYRNPYI